MMQNIETGYVPTIKRLAKNMGWLFIATVITRILSLVLIVYIARQLGDIDFGKFSFAKAFVQLFIVFSDFGLGILTIREVARDRTLASKYLGNFSVLKIILSVFTFSLLYIATNILNYPRETSIVVYIIGLYFILTSFAELFRAIFFANERMEYSALLSVIEKLILLSLAVSVLYLGYGLITLVSAYLVAGIVYLLLNITFVIWKFAKPKFKIDLEFWLSSIKKAYPFALGTIISMIFLYIDVTMLSKMKGDQVVGWYSASFGLIYQTKIIPSVFLRAIFPIMSRFFVNSSEYLKKTYEKSFKFLFGLGLPISVGGAILAKRIILLLYGQDYVHSIVAFKILIWAIVFFYLNTFFGYFFASLDKQVISTKFLAISAGVNIVLNLILIPSMSYVGASIATVISEIVFFGLAVAYLSRTAYNFSPIVLIIKSLFASLIMGLFVYYFKEANLFLIIFLGACLYFLTLYLIGYLDKEDKSILRRIVRGS